LHQYVTHNRYYQVQKQFADAILAFMRGKPSPQEMEEIPRQGVRQLPRHNPRELSVLEVETGNKV